MRLAGSAGRVSLCRCDGAPGTAMTLPSLCHDRSRRRPQRPGFPICRPLTGSDASSDIHARSGKRVSLPRLGQKSGNTHCLAVFVEDDAEASLNLDPIPGAVHRRKT